MSLVRVSLLSLATLGLMTAPVAAQAYRADILDTRSGERMFVAFAAQRQSAPYPYIIYGILRSRPEGYFWVQFRRACGSGSNASSHGFVRWSDGGQSVGDANSLFRVTVQGEAFADGIQCHGHQGQPQFGTIEGRSAVLNALRQAQTERW